MDALADAGGQQVLSPYHAMACNPVIMVDPLGLRSDVFDNGARPIDNTPRVSQIIPMNTNARYILLDQIMYADQAAFIERRRQELTTQAVLEALDYGLSLLGFESRSVSAALGRSMSGTGQVTGDDYAPDNEKDSDGLTMYRFNLFKYSIESASEEIGYRSGIFKRGIRVKIVSQIDLSGYKDIDWIQSVFTSDPIDGRKKYEWSLDGKTKEEGGNPPFYWGSKWDADRKVLNQQYGGMYFSDFPGRNTTVGNFIWFGQLSLVGKSNGRYENIMTINYGFSIFNGVTTIHGPYLGVPTTEQNKFINNANNRP